MGEYSWFIARVRIGAEENVRQRCLDYLKLSADNMIRDCYVFRYEEQRRIRGGWIVQEKILFPGYVFIVVDLTGNAKKDRLSDTVKIELMLGDMKPGKLKKMEQAIYRIKGVIELMKIDGKPAALNKEGVQLLRLLDDCG
ncbi:transcription termination/antitermination NusG family protein [Lachnospiraceae bacterium 56-18]|jgi:transcriptional antiterminator NusG